MWFRNLGRVKKKKKCYVHNIFTINHMWLVIISSKKNLWQTNCGNAIAEIGRKTNCDKQIVAMALPKLREKKNLWQTNCGNAIAEIGE